MGFLGMTCWNFFLAAATRKAKMKIKDKWDEASILRIIIKHQKQRPN